MSEFDTIIDRRSTGSLKWERYAGRDVLPLWVADMDFAVPDCVLEAVRSRLDHGILGYSVAHQGVREAITDYLKDLLLFSVVQFQWALDFHHQPL